MSNSKDSTMNDQLEEDSTLNELNDLDDGTLGLEDSDEIDLNDLDSAFESDLDTSQNPKDFLDELELGGEDPNEQTDLNDILRDLEASSDGSSSDDDGFEDELVELSRDDMLDQDELSFDDEEELAAEDDTQGEDLNDDLLDELEDPSHSALEEIDDESADAEMDQLLSEMEDDTQAEAMDTPQPREDTGFQAMDEFDDEGEALDEADNLLAAAEPLPEPQDDTERLRELDDDELMDALDQASFDDNEGTPDSALDDAMISAKDHNEDDLADFGEDIYAQQHDEDPDYSSDFVPDQDEEVLETIDDELPEEEQFAEIDEPPESDEAYLPEHVGETAASDAWNEMADQRPGDDLPNTSQTSTQSLDRQPPPAAPYSSAQPAAGSPTEAPARSGLGLAVLGVIVALGGASGFWYTTQLGGDVNLLKADVEELQSRASKGTDGGTSRRDLEQLRDNLFAVEKRMEKPIAELRTNVSQQVSDAQERIERLEQQTNHMDQRIAAIGSTNTGGSGSMGGAQAPDWEPRFTLVESRIQDIQGEVQSLREAIVSSSSPTETAQLKNQLLDLTQEVVTLKAKLNNTQITSAAAAPPSTQAATASVQPADKPATDDNQPQAEVTESPTSSAAETATATATAETATTAADTAVAETTAAAPSGPWGINLRSYASRELAEKGQQELAKMDLDTLVREAQVSGKTWYRLRIEGFASSVQAKRYINEQLAGTDFTGAWISRNP